MKILITGTNGQVGNALMHELTNHNLIGLTRKDCDLINPDQIRLVIDQHRPELIINSAAFTMVDQAEDQAELVLQINRDAPRVMAEKAGEYNIPFIHFSTDYVFDGDKKEAYTENDPTHPLGIYAQSKCAGEKAIQEVGGLNYIFRTSWVYSNIGHNFYLTMKRLSQELDELKVVGDQVGIPTSNQFIAEQIKKIIPQLNENNTGVYHLVPDGSCSWYEFANEIFRLSKYNVKTQGISTDMYPTKAKRPKNSVLDKSSLDNHGFHRLPHWKDALKRYIQELGEQ